LVAAGRASGPEIVAIRR